MASGRSGASGLSVVRRSEVGPLQFKTLFLGPDRSYFSRFVLLVLRSEVTFN